MLLRSVHGSCHWMAGLARLRFGSTQLRCFFPTGHVTCRGTAPAFATTKLGDIKRLEKLAAVDPATGGLGDVNAPMCLRRLKVYTFGKRVDKQKGNITFCAECFAGLILTLGQPSRTTFL